MKLVLSKITQRYLPLLSLSALLFYSCQTTKQSEVTSPGGTIKTIVNSENGLQYSVVYNEDTLLTNSEIDITLKGFDKLDNFEIISLTKTAANNTWEHVWGKRKTVSDHYNELQLQLKEIKSNVIIDLYVRAYNDGVGIRYGFPKQDALTKIELTQEKTQFSFADDYTVWAADYKNYKSSQEQPFPKGKLSDIQAQQLIAMPLLVETSNQNYAVITEANLTDWAGAFLRLDETKPNTIVTDLAPLPKDSTLCVIRETPALSPWRTIMLGNTAGDLIESDLIANLNDPVTYDDVSWIQPGASAWDWWWSNKYAPSADFVLGPNQETMKYYIDFASEMGWQYQIVDWQWYGEPFGPDGDANPDVDITTCIDGINIEELVKYAASKNVKIILWGHWKSMNKQMDEALALYEKWGVAGIKIDFMDRQDQEMVNYYHKLVKKAAEHHLVVDFHGAYKPTGVSRTYPNLITREGVMGNEYNKWSHDVTPEHNVTLPFTRGLLGEMDYTPVSFNNVRPDQFVTEDKAKDLAPMVMSTRCHQLAMPVVYESAFTVFCDSPDRYKTGVGLYFLKSIPTTWDETKVLNASVGNYLTVARKAGDLWYIGSMTDADERELTIDFSFLDEGKYKATLFEDAADANENPANAVQTEKEISNTDKLTFKMAKGGGFAAIIKKK
ncbi:glycoside hydrolase family 97 protein [Carboxylicivirga linearis]|uniref:Glycoside hydrolase family 97 protein n=1 Tax=Carboxylicivirga linearis TaxID=1628157 RepID=A0ABS5JUQ7_9BACT|nr:glycoside hydrolase family 97 protein [Carboxylicivirga linearis]MBS2098631.1 glycoside hydrolase family 97 protein [Carboxylicivirga linearis]